MATRIILYFLAMVAPAAMSSAAPMVWRWSNPGPHGNNIIDMTFKNGLAVQVAERGQIYTSQDFVRWIPRASGTTNALRAVTFFNDRIIVTGENGTVLYADSPEDFRRVNLGTSDWLEAVTASPSLLVAAGDNGAIYTSGNGISWQRQSTPFNDWLRGVAFGTPGNSGLFVAAGEEGFVATSANGVQWQPLSQKFTTQDLNRVAWSNGQFWILGNGGAVFVSSNGTLWQPVSTGATNDLNDLAASPDSRLIAGDNELRLQENRSAWADELSGSKLLPAPSWNYLSAVWNGQSYWVAGRTGFMVEGFKTNSTTSPTFWLPYDESLRNWLWDLKRFPNLYLAVGDRATLLSSGDGVNWTIEIPPEPAANSIFLGIGGRTNLAVVVGSAGSIIYSQEEFRDSVRTNSSGAVVTNKVSTLGIVWDAVNPRPTTNDLQAVTAFQNTLVVGGGSGTILTSSNARDWTRRTTRLTQFISSLESFPGGVVAVGQNGLILTSPDTVNWTQRNSNTTDWVYRVRYVGGRLIAVGQNGTILTSSDGVAWTRRNSGTTRWLNDVAFVNNTYYAVGNQGTVLTSADAVNWSYIGTITEKSLFAAAATQTQLVVAGVEGVILRSQVVPDLTPIRFLAYPANPSQNHFVFLGNPDQRFTLDRSTNLRDWNAGPVLEITDPSGLLTYQDPRGNSPSQQYYRAKPR